jgi:hypothetical protein
LLLRRALFGAASHLCAIGSGSEREMELALNEVEKLAATL